jgi:hypothetical protein
MDYNLWPVQIKQTLTGRQKKMVTYWWHSHYQKWHLLNCWIKFSTMLVVLAGLSSFCTITNTTLFMFVKPWRILCPLYSKRHTRVQMLLCTLDCYLLYKQHTHMGLIFGNNWFQGIKLFLTCNVPKLARHILRNNCFSTKDTYIYCSQTSCYDFPGQKILWFCPIVGLFEWMNTLRVAIALRLWRRCSFSWKTNKKLYWKWCGNFRRTFALHLGASPNQMAARSLQAQLNSE